MIVFTVPGGSPSDTAFLQDLYHRYSRLMYAEALRRVSNRQDCEDIVQEAVASLCEKVDTLRGLPPAALPAYIVYTVKNKSINLLRRQGVAGRHTVYLEDGDELPSSAPSPQELAELRERADSLYQVWSLLTEEDRELLYRKYVLDQDGDELAEVFHCRKDSVRMRLTRARRRAAALMKKEGGIVRDKTRTLA